MDSQTTKDPLAELVDDIERRIAEARRAHQDGCNKGSVSAIYEAEAVCAALVGLRDAHDRRMIEAAERGETFDGGSLRRVGRLCARWRDNARTMDELADECDGLGEEKDAAECLERARTFRECANDLASEWAGTEPTHRLDHTAK